MFDAQTLHFLSDLKANNSRDWFTANRARYEAHVAAPAAAFLDALKARLGADHGCRVTGKLFRLNRDLRFSKDKTPYNAHVHMAFAEAGPGMWMVGLEPGSLVIGYGTLGFDAATLDRYRAAVNGPAGAALAGVLAGLQAQGLRLPEPELKRVPAPFEATHSQAALLRRKSLLAWRDGLPVETAYGPEAVARIADALAVFDPLRDWLTRTL